MSPHRSHPCLTDFAKRLPFIAAANSLIERRGRNSAIENRFMPYELTNMLIAILCFIMDRTLSMENPCLLSDIEAFIRKELIPYTSASDMSRKETEELTRYCVVTILQNRGEPPEYTVTDFEHEGAVTKSRMALIQDELIETGRGVKATAYKLTDMGFNFMFHSGPEIDQHFEYDVNTMILQQQLEKGQYDMLVRTAREWMAEIRYFVERINVYELQISHDVLSVDAYALQKEIEHFYSMAAERGQHAKENLERIQEAKTNLNVSRMSSTEIARALRQLKDAEVMIGKAENLIRTCLLRESEIFQKLKAELERYTASMAMRFDMKERILDPLLRHPDLTRIRNMPDVLAPLFYPVFEKHLSPLLFYLPQPPLSKPHDERNIAQEVVESIEDEEADRRALRVAGAGIMVLETYMRLGKTFKRFRLSDVWESLIRTGAMSAEHMEYMVVDSVFYQVCSVIYQEGEDGFSVRKVMAEMRDVPVSKPDAQNTTFNIYYALYIMATKKHSLIDECETYRMTKPDDGAVLTIRSPEKDGWFEEMSFDDMVITVIHEEPEEGDTE